MKECPPHHFRIDSPSGPTSLGTCKHCGECKQFTNTAVEDRIPMWNDKTGHRGVAKGKKR